MRVDELTSPYVTNVLLYLREHPDAFVEQMAEEDTILGSKPTLYDTLRILMDFNLVTVHANLKIRGPVKRRYRLSAKGEKVARHLIEIGEILPRRKHKKRGAKSRP